jgi:DNA-binding HxlR family transcriptional regulator
MANAGEKKSRKKRPAGEIGVHDMVESIVGCKWSLVVLARVRRGICRPGELVHSTPGLTTKVLNERLRKMVRFGILDRVSFPEIPPRVEYRFTELGRRFLTILDAIDALETDLSNGRTQAGAADAE